MSKKLLFAVLVLVLLAAPSAIRWLTLYEGRYEPSKVARPNLDQIMVPELEAIAFSDRFTKPEPGVILIDRAHSNRFELGELSVLQARLSARGQLIEPVETVENLEKQLRYANALIAISPGEDWAPEEVSLVQDFVNKGGRLLLVTDPTRYGIKYDEWDMPILDADVDHMNGLASRFGILFQSDYLYNTQDNAGNFRNVKLTEFGSGSLTNGLEEIVFFAAHSIVSEELALIQTAGETRSSSRGRQDVSVAVLAANGKVLALGDLTFLFEPYNAVYDNDQFIAHIASFLAGAERDHDLVDFPFFFRNQVDLIYVGDPVLDSDLLSGGSALQALFSELDKELALRQADDGISDTLFFGLYGEAGEVESYLIGADVVLPVPSTSLKQSQDPGAPSEKSSVAMIPTVVPSADVTVTAPMTTTNQAHIQIGSVGNMVVTSTALLLLQEDGERQVLVVLSDKPQGLENAIERLSDGDLGDCLIREAGAEGYSRLALCPTGEAASGSSGGGWEKPQAEAESPTSPEANESTPEKVPPDESEDLARVMVVSLDHGTPRYMGRTEAGNYAAVLTDTYEVDVWSTREKGLPAVEDLLDYDLTIWTGGDYQEAMGEEESDLAFEVMLAGIPVMASGAFVYDSETVALQQDVQVHDADHPLTKGFDEEEVIPFLAALEGGNFETAVLDDVFEEEGTSIPFVRGPKSESQGVASVFVVDDPLAEIRFILIGFPIYLLPEPERELLVQNSVDWLLGP